MFSAEQSHQVISDAIIDQTPFAIGKLGANECNTLYRHINNIPIFVPDLETGAGVFPLTQETISKFSKIYLEDLKEIDILLSWAKDWGEDQILNHIGFTNNQTDSFKGIEPFFIENNWTNHLGGKKVLVISSHMHSIEHQYPNLSKIWNGKLFKDKFELYLLKSPFQPQFERYHNSWFETLDWLKANLKEIDFDIMLVGAGAYSLPLIVEAKRLGKVGIHLGGAIQLLFGINGKRWDSSSDFQALVNEYWIRPLKEDTPSSKEIVEGGCYW
jgi:hypothetical protein